MTDLHERSASQLAAAVRDGEVRAEEVVATFLDRVTARESELRAWAHLDPDRAIAEARRRDADEPRGPLHGVPVGVKDIVDTGDLPTEHGSPIYRDHRPSDDAVVVARLRAAGAVVLGKTVTTEFAFFTPGPTTNPHDPARTPGGSSSGSAAAVAARTVPLAVGTQTAGSVVRPASFCGTVGAKPTFGVVPTAGVKPAAPSLDTVGVFTNDVGDAALALGVMADDLDRFRPADLGERPRIGFARTHEWDQLEPATRAALDAAVERLARHVEVVEVVLPASFAGLVDAQQTVMATEALRMLADERSHHADLLSDGLRTYLEGAEALVAGYDDAISLAARCRDQLPEAFAGVEVVLAPSVIGEAPSIETTGDPLLCRAWTLLGTPTVAVPGLRGPAGLPLGVQTIALPGRDDLALGGAAIIADVLGAEEDPGRVRPGKEEQ
jgi:Asp-tRNA(Asn)/Glu-tRNA(Gln) amidotransferase A subunit family amidase